VNILFLTENFPPETNAAATRVFERALYWVRDGHQVTVITSAPNFPQGRLHGGWQNRWHQTSQMEGIRVVRVKTYIAANRGTARRTLDFVSFMITAVAAGLFEKRPDVIAATSPQFFAAWVRSGAFPLFSSWVICGRIQSLQLVPCGPAGPCACWKNWSCSCIGAPPVWRP
jgi:hypothetical protein